MLEYYRERLNYFPLDARAKFGVIINIHTNITMCTREGKIGLSRYVRSQCAIVLIHENLARVERRKRQSCSFKHA